MEATQASISRGTDKEDTVYIYIHTHTHTMEYYSAIQRNEIGSFVEIWVDPEIVIQGEVSQKEKTKYRMLMHICGI